MAEERKFTRFWWESPKETPLGRLRRRWEGIRIDLRKTGWGGGAGIRFDWLRTGTRGELL
jgi:hypothetical protein